MNDLKKCFAQGSLKKFLDARDRGAAAGDLQKLMFAAASDGRSPQQISTRQKNAGEPQQRVVIDLDVERAKIAAEWERLDIVVCNAGGGIGSPWGARASELDLAEFDAVLRKNLYGTVNTCVAAAPMLKAATIALILKTTRMTVPKR